MAPEVAEQLEIDAHYAGYLERQQKDIVSFRNDEALLLPPELDYASVGSLSHEIRDKLARSRPATLGAAARVSGVTPAALVALLKHVKRRPTIPSPTMPVGLGPSSPAPRERSFAPNLLSPLSRTAGEGAERSEAGEGRAAANTLTLPRLRRGPLPLPRCGRGAACGAT